MQNGLLVCSGTGVKKNIGDYIQSLASEMFFDKIDVFVERERLNEFQSAQKTLVIFNGWFMWQPMNWPPSNDIVPLFISFHIVPKIANQMLSAQGIAYLKQHAPIGCRDTNTMKILDNVGIPNYFSGCLTLALGQKYKSEEKNRQIIFVDPYYESGMQRKNLFNIKITCKNFVALIKHWSIVKKIEKRFTYEFHSAISKFSSKLDHYWQIAAFYNSYKDIFSDDVLCDAEYITHDILQSDFKNDTEKLDYARYLVDKYAKARLVVTSRIHCALPCLGVETPVLFVTSENLESEINPLRSQGRFGGLMNLFHVLRYTSKGIICNDKNINDRLEGRKIGKEFLIENKPDYKKLRDKMIRICADFVNGKN